MESAKNRTKFGKSNAALYENFVHKYQLLVPEFSRCSANFLTQVQEQRKLVLKLSEARHFSLPYSKSLKGSHTKDLYSHCKAHPVLAKYIPDDCVPDREFLLQLIATTDLPHLVKLTRKLLRNKKVITREARPLKPDECPEAKDEVQELLNL